MVAFTKDQLKEKFSDRLNMAVEEALNLAKTDRPHTNALLKLITPLVDKISYEAVRKWVSGETIPDMTHLSVICSALNTHPTWLLTEKGPMKITDETPVAGRHKVTSISRPWPISFKLERITALHHDDQVRLDETTKNRLKELEANRREKKSGA